MSDQDKIRHLLDELDCDAVFVVALRDPKEEGGARRQSLVGVSREGALSAQILRPLAGRVATILGKAFASAGIATDFVDRSTEGGNGEGDSGIEIIR